MEKLLLSKQSLTKKESTYLDSVYNNKNNPLAFSSLNTLYKGVREKGEIKISKRKVGEWLNSQNSHTLFKQPRRVFARQRIISSSKFYQLDVDTLNMGFYSKRNNGYSFILVCIDTFTRYLITRPLYSLKGKEMKSVFEDIFKTNKIPKNIRSDGGSEFNNVECKRYFKSLGINHFTTRNETKASMAERCIKTIRLRIARMLKAGNTHKWIDSLKEITSGYNNTTHSAIGSSPESALRLGDKNDLWKYQYIHPERTRRVGQVSRFSLEIGDRVRISHQKQVFERAYDERWTKEIFTITDRRVKQGFEQYRIKSEDNEDVSGMFYPQELQKVYVDENTLYEVEKVLKERRYRGRLEYLVRWMGYRKSFDSWIPADQVRDI